jgi:hypothetical protein
MTLIGGLLPPKSNAGVCGLYALRQVYVYVVDAEFAMLLSHIVNLYSAPFASSRMFFLL